MGRKARHASRTKEHLRFVVVAFGIHCGRWKVRYVSDRASSVPIFPIFPIFFNFPYIFLFNSKTPYNPYNVRLKRQKGILAESCKTDSAHLAFVLSMKLIFKKFLCFFESEGPLINLLRYEMCKLLKLLMDCFLKETEGNHLLTVEYSKSDNLPSNSQIEVGENTRFVLSKLTTDQQKVAFTGMKQFYVEATKYLINHLPTDNKLCIQISDIVRWGTSYS